MAHEHQHAVERCPQSACCLPRVVGDEMPFARALTHSVGHQLQAAQALAEHLLVQFLGHFFAETAAIQRHQQEEVVGVLLREAEVGPGQLPNAFLDREKLLRSVCCLQLNQQYLQPLQKQMSKE